MNKEDLGTAYVELMAKKYCRELLKRDRDALFRVMSYIKREIFEEEATCQTAKAIEKARK